MGALLGEVHLVEPDPIPNLPDFRNDLLLLHCLVIA